MLANALKSLDQYQQIARATAIYPRTFAQFYLLTGLLIEACELWQIIYLDSVDGDLPPYFHNTALEEAGDCLWFAAEIATYLNAPLQAASPNPCVPTGIVNLADALKYYSRHIADIGNKAIRDNGGLLTDEDAGMITTYLGFVVGYIERIGEMLGSDVIDIARRNVAKLADRQRAIAPAQRELGVCCTPLQCDA